MKAKEIISRIRQACDTIYEKYEGNPLIEKDDILKPFEDIINDYCEDCNEVGWSDKENVGVNASITAEILEKNGFMFRDNDGGYYGYFEESYFNETVEVVLFNVKNENRNCQLHISDENITYLHLMVCNYIYQLQQALKVCGIKKEIIL